MKRITRTLALAALTSLAVAPFASAQQPGGAQPAGSAAVDGAQRVAVCNPVRVFLTIDEKKALDERWRSQAEGVQNQVQNFQTQLRELERQRNDLKPDSAQWQEKNNQFMTKAVEFDVWGRLKQAELERMRKDQTRAMFDRISEACRTVALQRKIDLVVAERRPEIPADMTKVTIEQLQQALASRDVLYMDANRVDITDLVVAELNRLYALPPAAQGGQGQPAPGQGGQPANNQGANAGNPRR